MTRKHDVVLIRGLARESRHWGKFLEVLAKSEFCGEIFTCDLPGTGENAKSPSVASVAGMVRYLTYTYQSRFQHSRRALICGLSLGGMVALEYLRQQPQLFAKFVVINSSVKGLSPFYERVRPLALANILKIAAQKDVEIRERRILELTSNAYAQDPSVIARNVEIAQTRPIRLPIIAMQLLAARQFSTCRFGSIQKPGLVLCSMQDKLVHPHCSLAIARYFSLPFQTHPSAGHDLTLDDPEWVVKQIASFAAN